MKFYELELDGEIIKLRLTTGDCKQIEKSTGMSILDYIQNISITTICDILMYMRRSDVPNFTPKQAESLLDKFIDNDYTLEDIMYNVIYEGLVVSGFLKKADLIEMKEKATEVKKQITEKKTKELVQE